MFAECTTVESVLAQAIGFGSTCWEDLSNTGQFMGEKASAAALVATDRIAELAVQRRPSGAASE